MAHKTRLYAMNRAVGRELGETAGPIAEGPACGKRLMGGFAYNRSCVLSVIARPEHRNRTQEDRSGGRLPVCQLPKRGWARLVRGFREAASGFVTVGWLDKARRRQRGWRPGGRPRGRRRVGGTVCVANGAVTWGTTVAPRWELGLRAYTLV